MRLEREREKEEDRQRGKHDLTFAMSDSTNTRKPALLQAVFYVFFLPSCHYSNLKHYLKLSNNNLSSINPQPWCFLSTDASAFLLRFSFSSWPSVFLLFLTPFSTLKQRIPLGTFFRLKKVCIFFPLPMLLDLPDYYAFFFWSC